MATLNPTQAYTPMKRYYAPDLAAGRLDLEQSHHCAHVMRHQVGDVLAIFDGRGNEAKARITELARDQVRFQILAQAATARPRHPVCLAPALTKQKAMELIWQKATELGVSEIAPLLSSHSVAQLEEGEKTESRLEKWRKLTIEAAKQCGQNWLPLIHDPVPPREFIERAPQPALKLIASLQPEARSLKSLLREALPTLPTGAPILVMIGPEGDFSPAEIGQTRAAGFLPASLGRIVLRAETAAFFALGAIAYELME